MEREFTAVLEQDEEWWIGWCPEVRGAYGQGETLDEARESLREAIQLVLEDIAAQRGIEEDRAGVIRERILVSAS